MKELLKLLLSFFNKKDIVKTEIREEPKQMITLKELNPNNYTLTKEQESNLNSLLDKLNQFRNAYGKPMTVTSGVRSEADQQRINPSAPKSNHLKGLACDFSDSKGELREYVLANLELMKTLGLYFEDFRYTPNWLHCQCVSPASGKRIFVPSSSPAPRPDLWDGKYDRKFDS
jgi:hypothetical protein